jgi:hypothetical protein
LRAIAAGINIEDVQNSLINGDLIILYENKLLVVNGTMKREGRSVQEAIREASFEGGLETFVEQSEININLIRQYYHNDNLEITEHIIGSNKVFKQNGRRSDVCYDLRYVFRFTFHHG